MPTHDYILDNASGAAFRTDLNNALAAIVSNNSNSSSPATTYAYQWWADTSNAVLKIRNSANSDWIELFQLDGTLTLEDGSVSTPALAFRDDLNTGIFSSAADTFNVATGGVERMELGATTIFNEDGADVDFRIEGDTDANLFNLDASADAIGIGAAPITTGPKFEVTRSTTDAFVNATDCTARLINSDTSANTNQTSLQFTTKTTSTGADSAIVSQAEDASGNSRLEFWTDTSNGMTEKASIDSTGDLTIADGDLVIGTDGHGIDFSAQTAASNAYTKDSELLDHYEEGTFTPSVSSPQLNSCQLPAFTDASYTQRNGNYI